MKDSKWKVLGAVTILLFLSACGEKKEDVPEDNTQTEITETEPVEMETVEEEPEEDDGSYYFNGEFVVFGKYEQDGDLSNGPEPVEWTILEEDDEKMFLISRYILDCHTYNTEDKEVSWESCELRTWLNNDFYNDAFSPAAQQRILTTDISVSDNAFFDTDGGNDTQDKIFCLSVEEIWKYYEVLKWYDENQTGFSSELITDMTQYAEDNGADHYTITQEDYDYFMVFNDCDSDVIGKSSGGWWLRSPGQDGDWACMVSYRGDFGWHSASYVEFARNGVRPAMYIEK